MKNKLKKVESKRRFTEYDYRQLVSESFYSVKDGEYWTIKKESDGKPVAKWYPKKEELVIKQDNELINWLKDNSYLSSSDQYANGGEIESKRKELQQDIADMKDAISVTDDKEEKAMLQEGLAEFEKQLKELEEEAAKPKPQKEEKKEATSKRVSVKDEDIKVGNMFDLPNGEKIKIIKLFKENTDEDWVTYSRDDKTQDGSVKSLRIFLNNFGAVPSSSNTKAKPAPSTSLKGATVKEKGNIILVSWDSKPDWVVTIEKKGDKYHSSCCSDDFKHPVQETKEKAIHAAVEFLRCRELFKDSREAAKKSIEAKKKYQAKHGETNVDLTAKKAAETIENKVEKLKEEGKAITKSEAKKLDKSIVKIVAEIKVAIKSREDQKDFIKNLINELKKLL